MVKVYFRIGLTSSISLAIVYILVSKINFYVIKVDTSFLLSLANIDLLGLKFNNLKNTILLNKYLLLVIRQFKYIFIL